MFTVTQEIIVELMGPKSITKFSTLKVSYSTDFFHQSSFGDGVVVDISTMRNLLYWRTIQMTGFFLRLQIPLLSLMDRKHEVRISNVEHNIFGDVIIRDLLGDA